MWIYTTLVASFGRGLLYSFLTILPRFNCVVERSDSNGESTGPDRTENWRLGVVVFRVTVTVLSYLSKSPHWNIEVLFLSIWRWPEQKARPLSSAVLEGLALWFTMSRTTHPLGTTLHDYFATTPFDIYCWVCRGPQTPTERALSTHVKTVHNSTCSFDYDSFLSDSDLRKSVLADPFFFFNYISYQTMGSVCGSCGEAYLCEQSIRSHCLRKDGCDFKFAKTAKVFVTKCGRVVSDHRWNVSNVVLMNFGLYRGYFCDYR
jgi:hypothetical protein